MKKILLLLPLLFSCAGTPVATLEATVPITGDTGATAFVRVKFTSFSQPVGTGGNDTSLRLHFSNPEGDTMDFVLAQPTGGFTTGSLDIDQSDSTLEATFTVKSNNQDQSVTVTADSGSANFININSIGLNSSGQLTSLSADYRANFAEGGNGFGAIGITNE